MEAEERRGRIDHRQRPAARSRHAVWRFGGDGRWGIHREFCTGWTSMKDKGWKS